MVLNNTIDSFFNDLLTFNSKKHKEDNYDYVIYFTSINLLIYNTFYLFLDALFNDFILMIKEDNDISISELEYKGYLEQTLRLNLTNYKYIEQKNLSSDDDSIIKFFDLFKSFFTCEHFGSANNNKKMEEKLNTILGDNWFSTLTIIPIVEEENDPELMDKKVTTTNRYAKNYLINYSKRIRHTLAHEIITLNDVQSMEKDFNVEMTIKIFQDIVNKISIRYKELYCREINLKNKKDKFTKISLDY